MAGKMAAEDWFLFRCLFMAQIKLHTTRTFNYLEYVELPVRVSLTLSLSLSLSLSLLVSVIVICLILYFRYCTSVCNSY